MRKIPVLIFVLFLSSLSFLNSQSYSWEGYVLDENGNSLVGANIYEAKYKKGTVTNEQGYFNIMLSKGEHLLKFSYIGFKPVTMKINIKNNYTKDIVLKHLTLNEIVINGAKNNIHLNPVQKPMEMDMITIGAIPSIIGEPDVMKALTLMPGIAQTSEISSNLTIRGASHDQNLIILDEAPLYQTGHLFGFESPFNYEAIKDVKVFKNVIPAIYGGKLSSVIELHSKNGNIDSTLWNYSYGLLNAGFSVSTPIVKDKLSFFAAARSFYLGLVTLPWYVLYKQKKYDAFFTYYLYDINANLKFVPDTKNEYSIYAYYGKDILPSRAYADRINFTRESFNSLRWGNQTLSLKYKHKFNGNSFLKNHLTYSKSFNKTIFEFVDYKDSKENHGKSKSSSLENISLKSYFEKYINNHNIRFGLETGYYFIQPFKDIRTGLVQSSIVDKYNYLQTDLFIDDLIEFKKWSFYAGLRFSNYFSGKQYNKQLEPRLSAHYKFNNSSSIGLGYQHLAQYSFLLPITNLGLPNDMWVSLLDKMKPSIIDQIFLEYNKNLFENKINIQADIFYRRYSSLYDIKNKTSFLFTSPYEWYKKISRGGKGYSYGVEIQSDFNFLRNKWIVSYTYSRNKYHYDDLNNGIWFNGYYDIPHQLDVNTTGKISKKWIYSAHFILSSGKPITLPKELLQYSPTGYVLIFGTKNGSRFSQYHRLDVSVSKSWTNKKGKHKTLTFSLYNAYYHKNPFYYEYIREDYVFDKDTHTVKTVLISPRFDEISILPIVPSVSYSVKF